MRRVLITGAGSYVGGKVRERLELEPERFEVEELDVQSPDWRRFDFSGFDCVYHVAGIAHVSADPSMESLYMSVNRDLAIEVGRRAKEAGVHQLIFMSSSIVYGDAVPPEQARPITKETPINPSNYYGLSKVEAEIGLMELASQDFHVAILRCPMIYGPGCKGNFPRLVKIARILPVFPDIDNKRSILYIGNLAELVVILIETGVGGLFLPQNAEWSSTSQLVQAMARTIGRHVRLTKAFDAFISLLLGKNPMYNKVFGSLFYDQACSSPELGYRRWPLEESVRSSLGAVSQVTTLVKRACVVNCFDTYAPRARMVCECLKAEGFEVKLISSDFLHIAKEYRLQAEDNEVMVHVSRYGRNISLARVRSHRDFCRGVRRLLFTANYDLIWALVPPNGVGKVCSAYKSVHPTTRLVVDVIDMWPETMPYPPLRTIAGLSRWAKMRDKALDLSDLVVTECDLFANRIRKANSNLRVQAIHFARESRYVPGRSKTSDDRVSLCYLGSINHIADIEAIGDIVSRLSVLRPVEVHIVGQGESQDNLEKCIRDHGGLVVSHGAVYDWNEKQRIFDMCHYGLNVMRKSVFVGLTMKSIDYLDAGLPLINTVRGDTWDLVSKCGVGHNYPDDTITNEDLMQNDEMRCRARSLFKSMFSRNVFVEGVRTALDAVEAQK